MTEYSFSKEILLRFYEEDSDLFRLLWGHSLQVAELAYRIARHFDGADLRFVQEAALLHDIGVIHTHAPSICCVGTEPYMRHGVIGAEMLRSLGMPRHALVCERHTGCGLTREDVIAGDLPLPHDRDFMPVSLEEQIICYADKFFSKSKPEGIKSLESVRRATAKFGDVQMARFEAMHARFGAYLND